MRITALPPLYDGGMFYRLHVVSLVVRVQVGPRRALVATHLYLLIFFVDLCPFNFLGRKAPDMPIVKRIDMTFKILRAKTGTRTKQGLTERQK